LVLVVENLRVIDLVQEILRGLIVPRIVLVDLKLLYFGLGLSESLPLFLTFGLFGSLSFLQFLHFRSLGSSFLKFVENVLVVEDCVSELIFESFTAQKLANSALNLGCP
jgi:hypothetical protein